MNAKVLWLCSALTLAPVLGAREKSDVLIMRNGDRLTCEVKNLDSDVLYIKLDYVLSTISLDWRKVDHIESKQMFMVKTEDGSVYSGTLNTAATGGMRPIQIEIVESPAEKVEVDKRQIIHMEETAQSFLHRFNGQIAIGATYNRGNQSAQYNLNADTTYPRERWSATATYSSNLSASNGASTSTRNELDLSAQRLLRWNNWYHTGLAELLQSTQQGISLQDTFGGGIGRYVKNSGRLSLAVTGGFGWQQINYQEAALPARTQQVTSGLVASQLNVLYFDRTTLNVNAMLLPAISDPGRVHFNLNASYYIKLWKKLSWNFSFYGNWDNRPPAGFATADYGTSSGVNWKFGNR